MVKQEQMVDTEQIDDGQALCKRTLDVVESLSHKHGEKIRYFLSKVSTKYEKLIQSLAKNEGFCNL